MGALSHIRLLWAVILLCGLGACKSSQPPAPAQASKQVARSEVGAEPRGGVTLTAEGVGSLRVGHPFPKELLSEAELAQAYETSFYSDAQPLEGFRLMTPPVFVAIDNGAFADWGMANPGDDAPASVRDQTLALVRAGGAMIAMVVADRPGLAAKAGLEVGAPLTAFHKAHPDATVKSFPPLWEDPTCVAQADGLWFFFDPCPQANNEAGQPRIKRVVSRR